MLRHLLLIAFLATPIFAATSPTTRQWTVDDIQREALVYAPPSATTQPSPLIFAFHGHGGRMPYLANRLAFQDAWPQAIVVYPQGIPTPGKLTDKEGKLPGWQSGPLEQNDRDLKFFDAMLESMEKEYKVDQNRVFATGHSNGASFTYVLWAVRRDRIAAFAPIASAYFHFFNAEQNGGAKDIDKIFRPILHIAGENDPLVKFEWQEHTVDMLRRINRCGAAEPAGKGVTRYPSTAGADVVLFVHDQKHAIPPEAQKLIVDFFKAAPAIGVVDKH